MKPLLFLVLALAINGGAALADDGWLGVQLQALDPDLTKALQIPDDQGVLVDDVVDDSPAANAGLKHGDVIVAFQGDAVHEVKDLTKAVRKASPGDEVAVTVLRDGKRQDLKVTLGERDDRSVFVLRGGDKSANWSDEFGKHFEMIAPKMSGGYLGIGMQDLTEQLGKHFGVEDGKGVLVSEVKPDTPAARAGLAAGDVITKAGGQVVADGSDLREALAGTEPGAEVTLEVVRDGKPRQHTVKLAAWPEGEGAHITLDGMRGDWPRMREFMPHGSAHELRVIRPDSDTEELRSEVEHLRKDLDELRQELKNR
jgi:S1-C subfamily serine protease